MCTVYAITAGREIRFLERARTHTHTHTLYILWYAHICTRIVESPLSSVRPVLKKCFAKIYHTWPSWSDGRGRSTDFGLQKVSLLLVHKVHSVGIGRLLYISMSLFQYLYNTPYIYIYIYNHIVTLNCIVLDAVNVIYIMYLYYKPSRRRSGRRCEIQPQKYDLRFVQRLYLCMHNNCIYLV